MGNEFNQIAKEERERQQAQQFNAMLEVMKNLPETIAKAVEKEVRKVREDLRNMDKLRPLRSSSDEQPVEEQKPE